MFQAGAHGISCWGTDRRILETWPGGRQAGLWGQTAWLLHFRSSAALSACPCFIVQFSRLEDDQSRVDTGQPLSSGVIQHKPPLCGTSFSPFHTHSPFTVAASPEDPVSSLHPGLHPPQHTPPFPAIPEWGPLYPPTRVSGFFFSNNIFLFFS